MQQERKILAQFDTDKNKRLSLDGAKGRARVARDAADVRSRRQARRAWLRRGGFVTASAGKRLSPADVKSYPTAALYDPATLRTIFLQFEEADWEQELADFNNTDVDVPATAIVDGKTYKDVGVHFRGMSSYFMVPEGSKRSLNLSFDFAHDKQALGGYRTLNLLNANGDPTFVRAVLYSEIARAYIPAPRMNYMRVGDQRRELGHLPERAAVQQGFPARQLLDREGRPLEGARQPRRPRRPGIPRRRCRGLQDASTRSRRRTIPRPGQT